MKSLFLITFCLLMLNPLAKAQEIICYSGNTKFYDQEGKNILYTENHIMFTEVKSKHKIITFADCLIVYHKKDKHYAAKKIKK